jgi:hypothetical protein
VQTHAKYGDHGTKRGCCFLGSFSSSLMGIIKHMLLNTLVQNVAAAFLISIADATNHRIQPLLISVFADQLIFCLS